MRRHQIASLKRFIYLACLLFPVPGFADSTHQFFVSMGASNADFDGSAKADSYGVAIGAYFEPVVLNAELPYFVSPFYQRIGGISVGYSRSELEDLNLISNGRVLNSTQSDFIELDARLAQKDKPFWLGLSYRNLKTELKFNGGQSSPSSNADSIAAQVGVYLTDYSNLFVFYADKDGEDSYGIGGSALVQLFSFGTIDPFFVYERVDIDAPNAQVINNVTRNAEVSASAEDIWAIGINYYPTVKTLLGIRYSKERNSDRNLEASSTRFSIGQYLNDNLVLTGSYNRFSADDTALSGRLDFDSVDFSLSVKF